MGGFPQLSTTPRNLQLPPTSHNRSSNIRGGALLAAYEDFQIVKHSTADLEYVERKLENLSAHWAFQFRRPWYAPVKEIRDYFGEKIALYFKFISFYTFMLCFISAFALSSQIILLLFNAGSEAYVYVSLAFGILTTIWSSTTLYFWQREENIFCIQ